MRFAVFGMIAFVIGLAIGYYYLMNKKEKAQVWNKRTKVLLVSAIGTFFGLFLLAVILSSISLKMF